MAYNGRMNQKLLLILLGSLLLAACAAAPQSDLPTASPSPSPRSGALTPFHTPTITLTPQGADGTPTPLPSLTPTPLIHAVKEGEDMFGIAFRYGLPLDAVMTANPSVNPRAMGLGTLLVIPAGERPTPTVANPTPTAMPLTLGQPACYRGLDGSLTCIAVAYNGTDRAVENLSALLRLRAEPGGEIIELPAFAPLNRLEPGASVPVVVVVPAPAPEKFSAGIELVTALPVPEGDTRYLPAATADVQTDIAADGLSARITGVVALEGNEGEAGAVWVTAVAYDAQGRMVGFRRWDSPAPLKAGESLPFVTAVYSLAGPIQRVGLLVEARAP